MIFVILKGPWRRGASLIVPYERGRFFPSSQTCCPIVHHGVMGVSLFAVRLSAWIAKILLFQSLDACSSAMLLFVNLPCSAVSGGSHPISNSLGAKPVVEFAKLLWTKVATASQSLQSSWFAVTSHRYCSIHWFFLSDRPSV